MWWIIAIGFIIVIYFAWALCRAAATQMPDIEDILYDQCWVEEPGKISQEEWDKIVANSKFYKRITQK